MAIRSPSVADNVFNDDILSACKLADTPCLAVRVADRCGRHNQLARFLRHDDNIGLQTGACAQRVKRRTEGTLEHGEAGSGEGVVFERDVGGVSVHDAIVC